MWQVRFSETEIKQGSFEQFKALCAKGRILPTTPVKAPGSDTWVPAGRISTLFADPENGLVLLDDPAPAPVPAYANPLAVPHIPPAVSSPARSGVDTKVVVIGGIAAGAIVLLLLVMVSVLAVLAGAKPQVASVPTPIKPPPEPLLYTGPVNQPPTAVLSNTPVIPPAVAPSVATPIVAPPATNKLSSSTLQPTTKTETATTTVPSEQPSGDIKVTPGAEMTLPQLIAHVQPSIVRIDVQTAAGSGVGSGFVVDDNGTVVTNLHVVAGATSARLTFADKTQADVRNVLALSKEQDLAILLFDATLAKSKPIALATQLPEAGERVAAFGAPQGLSFTTSDGIVSAVRSGDELKQFGAEFSATMVQTSAPISPGNSGGPLVNMKGEVVGVNTVQLTSGQNLNFAVSCTDVKGMLVSATSGSTRPLTELAKYEPPSSKATTFDGLEKKQKAALKLPPLVEEEWIIAGQPTKATLVAVMTAERESRRAYELDAKDFVNGKYTVPKGLKVRMKLQDGTEKEFNVSQLGTAGIVKARDRWCAEVYSAIKTKLVLRGNDRMQSLASAAKRMDSEAVQDAVQSLAVLYMFGDVAMPKEHSAHMRSLVEMNLELIVADGFQDNFGRMLADVEAALKAAVKQSPEMQRAFGQLQREMLAAPR